MTGVSEASQNNNNRHQILIIALLNLRLFDCNLERSVKIDSLMHFKRLNYQPIIIRVFMETRRSNFPLVVHFKKNLQILVLIKT